MTPSTKCAAFIRGFEKLRLIAYKPTPNDVWTNGYGATGRDIGPGVVWTAPFAEARFARDLADFGRGVDQLIAGAPTTQPQFDALTSFAYNVGLDIDPDTIPEGLGDSTLLHLHRQGRFAEAARQFAFWNHQNGAVLAGLSTRRALEASMYLGHYPPGV